MNTFTLMNQKTVCSLLTHDPEKHRQSVKLSHRRASDERQRGNDQMDQSSAALPLCKEGCEYYQRNLNLLPL